MPKIAEAVQSNIRYHAEYPDVQPIRGGQFHAPDSFPLVTFPPPGMLPLRGVLPPDLVNGTDFYNGARQFRNGLRSSVMVPPNAVSKRNTPQSLINKKLVAPIIGGGTPLNRYNTVTGVLIPLAVGAGVTATQTFTVSGISAADTLIGYQWISKQLAGVVALALRVVGDNLLAVDFLNPTAGPLTPTGGTISLFLVQ